MEDILRGFQKSLEQQVRTKVADFFAKSMDIETQVESEKDSLEDELKDEIEDDSEQVPPEAALKSMIFHRAKTKITEDYTNAV